MKSKLVTSYTLKHDVNRCFWNPAWSKCKHVYKPAGSFINNRVFQYVNTTDLIVIEHYHCRVPDKEWSFQDGGL